jgi:hypothetical protein
MSGTKNSLERTGRLTPLGLLTYSNQWYRCTTKNKHTDQCNGIENLEISPYVNKDAKTIQ